MCTNIKNNFCCCFITILSAFIGSIGITAALLDGQFVGFTIVLITLILSGLEFLYLLINSICKRRYSEKNLYCLLPTSVAGLITSITALFIGLATGFLGTAFLLGAINFFFILSVINLTTIVFGIFSNSCCEDKY